MSAAGSEEQPSPAGMYDHYLGGTGGRRVDREAAERILELVPEIRDAASANRGFLGRAVRFMAAAHGVRQFIDLGAGLPTQRCTHEVVADYVADGRVIYTDNDPMVIERGSCILAGLPQVAVIEADIRSPEKLFAHPKTRRLIDLEQPVGLLIVSVVQFVPDADDPWAVVSGYVDRLAAGSYLALSAATADNQSDRKVDRLAEVYARSTAPGRAFTRGQVERFFDGLDIVPPYAGAGQEVTFVGQWGAEDAELADSDGSRWSYAAVGRKP